MADYAIMKLQTADTIICAWKEDGANSNILIVQNPMLIDWSFDKEGRPQFKYVPWQLFSDQKTVRMNKENIVYQNKPKYELLDVYKKICDSFDGKHLEEPVIEDELDDEY